jgi:hypothetical protein
MLDIWSELRHRSRMLQSLAGLRPFQYEGNCISEGHHQIWTGIDEMKRIIFEQLSTAIVYAPLSACFLGRSPLSCLCFRCFDLTHILHLWPSLFGPAHICKASSLISKKSFARPRAAVVEQL